MRDNLTTEVRDCVSALADLDETPLYRALIDSLVCLGVAGTIGALRLWARASAPPLPTEAVGRAVEDLQRLLEDGGMSHLESTLRLAPLAAAKGDSRLELNQVLDRFELGLASNAFVTMDPRNKRFPVEIVGTGKLGPNILGSSAR